jgi:hypothetical protein
LLAALPLGAAEAPGADEWKYDVVHLKSGVALRGLVTNPGADPVVIHCVLRKPGSPTVVLTEFIARRDVRRLELLKPEDRARLSKRLDDLRAERKRWVAQRNSLDPKARKAGRPDDAVELRPTAWVDDKRVKALAYQSTYFRLVSTDRPEVVQQAAIHLEQIYAAYARSLPPRAHKAAPTTVVLTRSLADYHALARARGLSLFNPAFYDPGRNQVVCGSDLGRLADELVRVRAYHDKLRADLKARKDELTKVYRSRVPAELAGPLAEAEKRIAASEARNDKAFAEVQTRLFRRLSHEAFHAYLGNFVYPARPGGAGGAGRADLPHWFNEGLAQIFETAIVEVGELRVGHVDPARRVALRKALRHDELLPLADLLRSTPKQFLINHSRDDQVSDRHYLASWSLAFYLTFGRKVLRTEGFDRYLDSLRRGTDPVAAFRTFVGVSLGDFEKEYHTYLTKLN